MARGPQTDSSGRIQKPAETALTVQSGMDNLQAMLKRMQGELTRALPRHLPAERMMRIALTALRTTPDLALCTPASFLGCLLSTAQLGLEVNTPLGQAYLIPRNSNKVKAPAKECTLIIGYQGMLDMARRSGIVDDVYAYVVREGDTFTYSLGTDRRITHELSDEPARETRKITHVYAVAVLKNGSKPFVVLTAAQVDARRRMSAAGERGPWQTHPEAMTLKTAVRALNTWLPKSAEMARAEALEVAVDAGQSILSAADEVVTDVLAAHGVKDDAATVEVESEGAKQKDKGEQPATAPDEGAAREPGKEAASAAPAAEEPPPLETTPVPEEHPATAVQRLAKQAEHMLHRTFLVESPKGSQKLWLFDPSTLRRVDAKAERGVLVMDGDGPRMDPKVALAYVAALKATLSAEAGIEAA